MSSLPATDRIQSIRSFNRFYTRHLGVLEDGYLQSDLTLTEARILYELAHTPSATTAKDLQSTLGHNAGYLSRVLRKLRRANLVASQPSPTDGRSQLLSLTGTGGTSSNNWTNAPAIRSRPILPILPRRTAPRSPNPWTQFTGS